MTLLEGDLMADEPSPRAQWNVKVFINLGLLSAVAGLIIYGLATGQVTVKEILPNLMSAVFGGGITWLALK